MRSNDSLEVDYKLVGNLKLDPEVWGEEKGNIYMLQNDKVFIKVMKTGNLWKSIYRNYQPD